MSSKSQVFWAKSQASLKSFGSSLESSLKSFGSSPKSSLKSQKLRLESDSSLKSRTRVNNSANQQQTSGTPEPRQNFGQRFTRVRPQTFQRDNYAQQTALRRGGGPRSFSSPPTACGNCGLQHTRRNCPARQQECRHCGRVGHFARVCRSARLTSN
jgi:hypothetical protein